MIGWIKGTLMPAPVEADKLTKRSYDFMAGLVGGTLATLANTPFDVVSVDEDPCALGVRAQLTQETTNGTSHLVLHVRIGIARHT